jgi:hypothetical protein
VNDYDAARQLPLDVPLELFDQRVPVLDAEVHRDYQMEVDLTFRPHLSGPEFVEVEYVASVVLDNSFNQLDLGVWKALIKQAFG